MSDASEVNEGLDAPEIEQPEGTEEQAPFLEVDLDGEKLSFSSRDEALKHLREGTLRHSDYTRKTQEVAEHRKQVEAKEKELESQLTSFLEKKSEYDKMGSFLEKRPDVKDYILKQMRQPDPRRQAENLKQYADEQTSTLRKDLDSLKEKLEAEERAKQYEQQRKEVFDDLKGRYEDFDPDGVSSMLKEIQEYQSLPPKEALRNFAELLYYSRKGKESPVEREERQARSIERPSRPMQAGVKPIEGKGTVQGDMDEIAFKLKKEMGLS